MIIQMIFSSNGNVFGFVSPFTAKIAVRGLNTGSFMKASVELLSFLWEWIYSQWISHLLTSSLVVNRDARAVAKRQQKEIRKPDENDNHEVFACNACDLSKGVYIYIYIILYNIRTSFYEQSSNSAAAFPFFRWKIQHTPGAHPRPLSTCLWRRSSHMWIFGVPGFYSRGLLEFP